MFFSLGQDFGSHIDLGQDQAIVHVFQLPCFLCLPAESRRFVINFCLGCCYFAFVRVIDFSVQVSTSSSGWPLAVSFGLLAWSSDSRILGLPLQPGAGVDNSGTA